MPSRIVGNATSPTLLSANARKCPRCGLFTHQWGDVGELDRAVHKDWDVSNEGVQLISERLKSAFDELGVTDLDYKPMPKGGYAFRPKRAVFLDLSVYGVETHNFCSTCGQFESYLGGIESKIMQGETVGEWEIVRSAQAFGSEDYRAEDTIFGDTIMKELRSVQVWRNVQWEEVPFA